MLNEGTLKNTTNNPSDKIIASYNYAQDEFVKLHDIRYGDIVRITRKARDYELGWNSKWGNSMDECVGKCYRVTLIHHGNGFGIMLDNNYSVPFFVLEKVGEDHKLRNRNLLRGFITFILRHYDEIELNTVK